MSVSAMVQSAMRSTLGYMATPGLQYRQGKTGSWIDFPAPGAVFHAGPSQVVGYDENHQVITAPMTARLKAPDNIGITLAVAGPAAEWQVKQTDGTVWSVIGTSRHVGQTFYALARIVPTSVGQPRGAV